MIQTENNVWSSPIGIMQERRQFEECETDIGLTRKQETKENERFVQNIQESIEVGTNATAF